MYWRIREQEVKNPWILKSCRYRLMGCNIEITSGKSNLSQGIEATRVLKSEAEGRGLLLSDMLCVCEIKSQGFTNSGGHKQRVQQP